MKLSFGTDTGGQENVNTATTMPPSVTYTKLHQTKRNQANCSTSPSAQESTAVGQSIANTDSMLATHHALISTLVARIDQIEGIQAQSESK